MEIHIEPEGVIIRLKDNTHYSMTFDELGQVEKAIEIIRNLQESAHVDSATITVT